MSGFCLAIFALFARFWGTVQSIPGRLDSLLAGVVLCLLSCLRFEVLGGWPHFSLPWFGHDPERVLLGCLFLATWFFYLDFCRALNQPSGRDSKIRLLACLSTLACFMGLRAAADYHHFRCAMDLRLEACRLTQQGLFLEAIDRLESAIKKDSSQLDIGADLADLYHGLGCREQAVAALDRAIELSPHRPRPLSLVFAQRGRFLLKTGRHREARRDLLIALRWAPGDQGLRRLLRQATSQNTQ